MTGIADIENEIQEKGFTGPRVTLADVEEAILHEHYFTAREGAEGASGGGGVYHESLGLLTICVLVLRNGFMVTGESACASPEIYDPEIGRKVARLKATQKVWMLLGYALRDKLTTRVEAAARIAHEVNRAYCAAIGDNSQPAWEDAPEWQRASAMSGVRFHMANPDAGPSASHDNWLRDKQAEGWVYGEVKDADAKTHPCMVPFEELPREQQIKDHLFRAVVHAAI